MRLLGGPSCKDTVQDWNQDVLICSLFWLEGCDQPAHSTLEGYWPGYRPGYKNIKGQAVKMLKQTAQDHISRQWPVGLPVSWQSVHKCLHHKAIVIKISGTGNIYFRRPGFNIIYSTRPCLELNPDHSIKNVPVRSTCWASQPSTQSDTVLSAHSATPQCISRLSYHWLQCDWTIVQTKKLNIVMT